MINLLYYTKKLAQRIHFYDKLVKKTTSNPFAKPVDITIVWVAK